MTPPSLPRNESRGGLSSLTVENYLKATLQLSLTTASEWVTTGQLATALTVSPGTVTSMLKSLAESGLAEYRPYEGVRLSETGSAAALQILRRHRLIELFLVRTLNLTWDQVHDEAEHLEHAVSEGLINRIDEFLGHPETDPHGDPIPAADGAMRGAGRTILPLDRTEAGHRLRIVRVLNQNAPFLRFLSENGLTPGIEVLVLQRSLEAGTVELLAGTRPVTLGVIAAGQILGEPLSDP